MESVKQKCNTPDAKMPQNMQYFSLAQFWTLFLLSPNPQPPTNRPKTTPLPPLPALRSGRGKPLPPPNQLFKHCSLWRKEKQDKSPWLFFYLTMGFAYDRIGKNEENQ